MDKRERQEISDIYNAYSDKALIKALLVPAEDYRAEVYELILDICNQRGLMAQLNELLKERKDSESEMQDVQMPPDNDLIVLCSTNVIEAGMLKGLLEDGGITAFLKDELLEDVCHAQWVFTIPKCYGPISSAIVSFLDTSAERLTKQ